MKDPYCGDPHDAITYGLLRLLVRTSGLDPGVLGMRTAPDRRGGGEFRDDRRDPARSRFDPDRYAGLRRLEEPRVERTVAHAEARELLPRATYCAEVLTENRAERDDSFCRASAALADSPRIFFDPDNRLVVTRTPRGRRGASKYRYSAEVEEAYRRKHSLVISRHGPRRERSAFRDRLARKGAERLDAPSGCFFSTPHVWFLLTPRPEHVDRFEAIKEKVERHGGAKIEVSGGADFRTLRGFLEGTEPDEEDDFACGASLRIFGQDLDLDEIPRRLGVEPTTAYRKGGRRGPRAPADPRDAWLHDAPLPEEEPLEKHIDARWERVGPARDDLLGLQSVAEVDVFLGYRTPTDHAGIEVPHRCLEMFTTLEIPFGFSIIVTLPDRTAP